MLAMLVACGPIGCVVTQSQDTPNRQSHQIEASTGRGYWLYVPSTYTPDRVWPVVITLHGANGWDSASSQIREWKALAEERGLIVAAPELKSTQGLLTAFPSSWAKALAGDEQAVLAILAEVASHHKVDTANVLLTGFGDGGYPLYYTGLRHSDRFTALIARDASFREDLVSGIDITARDRTMPVMIFWGKDEFAPVQTQSWQAFRYLRERQFRNAKHKEVEGGQLRRPELVYRLWAECRQQARSD